MTESGTEKLNFDSSFQNLASGPPFLKFLDPPLCLFFSSSQSLTATHKQEALFGAALDGFPFLRETTITIQLLQIRHTAGPIKTKSSKSVCCWSIVSLTPLSCTTLCKMCSTVFEQGMNAKTHLINVLSNDCLPKALLEGIVNISHQNLSWKNYPTKAETHWELPPISKTVAQRRARFAGHCFHAEDQVISDLLLWRLPCPRRGNTPLMYPDTLARDAGLILNKLALVMANRSLWCDSVSTILTVVDWWWWWSVNMYQVDDDDDDQLTLSGWWWWWWSVNMYQVDDDDDDQLTCIRLMMMMIS